MLKTLLAILVFAVAVPGIGVAAPSNPVTASGRLLPGYTVAGRIRGYCWTSSIISTSNAAWRCMSGNNIYDPCFAQTHSTRVVYCLSGPGSKKLIAMTLTKPLQ
jgi:hypothetical protein